MEAKVIHTNKLFYRIMLSLIIVGTIFRFCYPFFSNPLDHLYSDPERHYSNAGEYFNNSINSWLDPPLPQFWLRAALFLFSRTHYGVAIYAGLLCAITPWLWYLWGRQIFTSKEKALVYLATLIYLPSWIGIYGFFMDETILLPAIGLALWLSWKAKQKNRAKYLILAILAWALALSIKLNAIFELVIVVPWLFSHFIKEYGYRFRSCAVIILSLAILSLTYLAYPFWVYQGLGATWLYPPGIGAMTKAFYLSGALKHSASFIAKGKANIDTESFGSNAMCTMSFEPFCDWKTWRKGTYNLIINCDKKLFLTPEYPHISLQKRAVYTVESIIYFFFSRSWPDTRPDDLIHIAQIETRWLWSLLTLFIIGLAWQKNRFKDMIVILCLGSALLYVTCDSSTIEGRYRKPWEGIALAAFVFLFNAPAAVNKKTAGYIID